MTNLVISMLVFNQPEVTKQCVESLLKFTDGEFLLHIWNNGSKKQTWEYLSAMNDPRIVCTISDQNIGFIKAHNHLFERYRNQCKYYCCLNNDMIFQEKGWNSRIIKEMERNGWSLAGMTQKWNLDDKFYGRPRNSPTLDYVDGSLFILKTDDAKFLPTLFDQKYLRYIYFEDSDLSFRLKARGMKIGEVGIKVNHLHQQTCAKEKIRLPIKENLPKNQDVVIDRWSVYRRENRKLKILVKRGYALGDVLCTEPILRELTYKYPASELHVDTSGADALKYCGLPIVRIGPGLEKQATYDKTINLHGAYEKRPAMQMVQAYAQEAGVVLSNPVPCYDPALRHTDKKTWRLIVSSEGSWANRTYDLGRWKNVINEIKSDGYEVIEVGNSNYLGVGLNMVGKFPGAEGIHRLAELTANSDYMLCYDSFLMHLAQAVGTPVFAVFGCIYPGFRIHDWPKAKVIWREQSELPCAGCHHLRPAPREFTECDRGKIECLDIPEQKILDLWFNGEWGRVPPFQAKEWK